MTKKIKVTDMIKEIYLKNKIRPVMMIYPFRNESEKHLMKYVKKRLKNMGYNFKDFIEVV